VSNRDLPPLPDHRACEALTGISIQHMRRDGSVGRVRSYRKGQHIWQPSDLADRIFFLQHGQVAIVACDAKGQEFTMRLIGPGEPFGELCFCSVTDSRRHCFSRALGDTSVVEVDYQDLYTFLQQDRQALIALTYTFCIRLSAAEERIDVLTHRDAEGRLGRLLISLATAGGADPNGKEAILRVSHSQLAQMAAMNRSHVTVTLGNFRKRGLVEYERGRPLRVHVQKLMVSLQSDAPKR
jgi:CRP/FNR family cyclic AMP-dependent transcriptional regulator